jgi:hypothetical protein
MDEDGIDLLAILERLEKRVTELENKLNKAYVLIIVLAMLIIMLAIVHMLVLGIAL